MAATPSARTATIYRRKVERALGCACLCGARALESKGVEDEPANENCAQHQSDQTRDPTFTHDSHPFHSKELVG
jgi:hypothetical protein